MRVPRSESILIRMLPVLAASATLACSEPGSDSGACQLDDSDGLLGGSYAFQLTVDDFGFSPVILKAQNDASVKLTLSNAGTAPHDLKFDCIPTPNDDGCPSEACFPEQANADAVAPGGTATLSFTTPLPEGIYDFRSTLPGDTQSGQFILQ